MGNKMVETIAKMTTSARELRPDLLLMNFTTVNAFLVGGVGKESEWVLVDTGLENSADFILQCVEKRFGASSRPRAIILTHGHFVHVGSVIKLAEHWDVPVYIHELEMPYVIDISFRAVALPSDGTCPGMPGWKWIHTPGHTDGHVSLFRAKDRTLLVGDAFTLTKHESLTDWAAAENSVRLLRDVHAALAIPSHGEPLGGAEFSQSLDMLIQNFGPIAKPNQGRFIP
ncbi:MAG TPA: MBL fold metallo-hydrolase [Limnochordia bacterium]|nr:MBL fold metallo-hydrolase [Limnochordia bacterium]